MTSELYDEMIRVLAEQNPRSFTVKKFDNCPATVLAQHFNVLALPTTALERELNLPAHAVWDYIIDPFDYEKWDGPTPTMGLRLQRVCDALASLIDD